MRYLIALASYVLLASSHAYACLGLNAENTLFFKTIPNPLPVADVIAEMVLLDVSVLDFYKGNATAKILRVIRSADARHHEGDIVSMKYMVSSCGPNHQSGDKGSIVANVGSDREGRRVLYPYTYRDSDGMFWPPATTKK